jgi:hypothetical protein
MNKRELDLLERAFAAEIDAAVSNGLGILQTKSKLAEQMVRDGLLERRRVTLGGRVPVAVEGYGLTLLGNLTYCMTCDDIEPDADAALKNAT